MYLSSLSILYNDKKMAHIVHVCSDICDVDSITFSSLQKYLSTADFWQECQIVPSLFGSKLTPSTGLV